MKLYCSKLSHNPYKEEMITEIREKVFEIDGYQVGGRLLEGVLFNVYFDDDQVIAVSVDDPHSRKYLENLNSKKWYQVIWDEAQGILDSGGDEVDVPDFIKQKYFKNGINCAYIAD